MQKIKYIIFIPILLYTSIIYGQNSNINRFLSDFPVAAYSSVTESNWESFYLRTAPVWIITNTEDYRIYNLKNKKENIHCIEKTSNRDKDILIFGSVTEQNEHCDSIIFHAEILVPDTTSQLSAYISKGKSGCNNSFKINTQWQVLQMSLPNKTNEKTKIDICFSAKSLNAGDKIFIKNLCLYEKSNNKINKYISHETNNDNEFCQSSKFSFPTKDISTEYLRRLETLCLTWGFMKYYHPDIRKGKHNWNYELFRMLPLVFNAKDYKDFCQKINAFIPDYIIKKHKNKNLNRDKIVSQIRKDWICNDKLGKTLYKRVSRMNKYGCEDDYIYCAGYLSGDEEQKNEKVIYFPNEDAYENIPVEDVGYRILALFRFWNMMYYFHPYIYQKEKEWLGALPYYIRLFADADNAKDFDTACTIVANALKDTHTEIYGQNTNVAGTLIWNPHHLPFDFKLINGDRLLVMKPLTQEAKECELKVGDYILKTDGKNIKDIREEKEKYSNFGKVSLDQYDDAYASFSGQSVYYTIERNGSEKEIHIEDFQKYWGDLVIETSDTVRTYDNNICYINLGIIPFDKLKELLPTIKNKQGIIFDMRGYPDKWNETRKEIACFLYPHKQTIWNYAYADLQHPGIFRKNKYNETFGEDNTDCYKGKAIVIVDRMTMSAAEHIAEIIRNSPCGMVIGEPTGGVFGRTSYAPFTSGRAARFTGVAVYLPNGKCTYPYGVHINKEVYPAPYYIKNNIDTKIKAAIDIINNK